MAANEPILDRDFAIKQLGGNEELLEKMFEKFLSQYANDANKVNEYIDAKEYQEARRTIHGIKGVSGNLGLKALQQACREAEELLRSYEDSPDDTQLSQYISDFEIALKSTLTELAGYKSTQNKATDQNSEEEADTGLGAEQAKATLVTAINNFQFIAPPELQKLLGALKATSINIEQLEKAIGDLDYELAKTLLNA